jgi:transposase
LVWAGEGNSPAFGREKQEKAAMSNSILFHAYEIRGFDHRRWDWSGGRAVSVISRKKRGFVCPSCGGRHVTATRVGEREVMAGLMGDLPMFLRVDAHRVKCHDCGAYRMESYPFLSSPKSHITRQLERSIVELRHEMSISAVAKHFDLDWRTVKEVEKRHLETKYQHIRLADVETVGVDEIFIGKMKYKTVVRDLATGAVLHVGDGKGGEALEEFGRRLRSSKAKIKVVAMDMSSGFAAWFKLNLPDAAIVFDHFHVIKLMNDRLDQVRRKTVKDLEEEDAKALKKNASCC